MFRRFIEKIWGTGKAVHVEEVQACMGSVCKTRDAILEEIDSVRLSEGRNVAPRSLLYDSRFTVRVHLHLLVRFDEVELIREEDLTPSEAYWAVRHDLDRTLDNADLWFQDMYPGLIFYRKKGGNPGRKRQIEEKLPEDVLDAAIVSC